MIGDRFGGLLEVDTQTRRRQNFESAIIKVKRRIKGFYPSELTIPCPNGTAKLFISRTPEAVHLKAPEVVNHSDHHKLGVGRMDRPAEQAADAPTLRCLPTMVDLTARKDLQLAPAMITTLLVGLMENTTPASPNLQPAESLTQHQSPPGPGQAPITLMESTVPVRPYTLPVEPMMQLMPTSGLRRGPQSPISISILPAGSKVVRDQGAPQLGVRPDTRHNDGNTCSLNAPLAAIQTTSPLKSKEHALIGEGSGAFNVADKGIEDLHNVDIQLATMMRVSSPIRDNWRSEDLLEHPLHIKSMGLNATKAQLEMSNIDAGLWHVFDRATVQDVKSGPGRLMFESQLNVNSMGWESQIEEGGSAIQPQTSVMGMGHTGDFSVGMIRSTAGVEQTNQQGDECSLFNESGGEAGLDDFGIEANETLQGLQEEGHTQLDAESQSDDSGESREIEVGVDIDEIIAETLEERILEAQLVDTTPTEPLTGNLIEREVEAIQHLTQSRAAVGLLPIGSTYIEDGGCEATPIDSSEFEALYRGKEAPTCNDVTATFVFSFWAGLLAHLEGGSGPTKADEGWVVGLRGGFGDDFWVHLVLERVIGLLFFL
ncbi:hypothetical protein Syun_027248 [Stephania yunnanensis]|uniref:Uncharacterized protein n=1 Tax=Stephania yunnanensis TaxID=152371 RepID=A0AAP0HPT2_9MAGN